MASDDKEYYIAIYINLLHKSTSQGCPAPAVSQTAQFVLYPKLEATQRPGNVANLTSTLPLWKSGILQTFSGRCR